MELKVKYLDNFVGKPIAKKIEDAGYDMYASIAEPIVLKPLEKSSVPLGISLELVSNPADYMIELRGRSGLNSKGIVGLVGTVDWGYRGELKAFIINLSGEEYVIEPGDRVAQIVITKIEHADIVKVENLGDSERMHKGFGSSGK